MKIHTKAGLFQTVLIAVVLCLSAMLTFTLVRKEIEDETNEILFKQRGEIQNSLGALIAIGPVGDWLSIEEITTPGHAAADRRADGDVAGAEDECDVSDTLILDSTDGEMVPYRQLTYIESLNGNSYRITLRHRLFEAEDLLEGIIRSTAIVLVVLLCLIAATNTLLVHRLWSPFRDALSKMRAFSIKQDAPLSLADTDVDEFVQLNAMLTEMTERMRRDYFGQKEFAENASHEMQTPVAVITSKLDMLLDDSGLDQRQLQSLTDAHRAANRLAQMNRGLLMLTRMESGRFQERSRVSIRSIMEEQLDEFGELVEMKGLRLEKCLDNDLEVTMNPQLASVLIGILLKNAITHNVKGGEIKLTTSQTALRVANTGPLLAIEPSRLFERFKKGNQSSPSTGLGLAIAQKICQLSDCQIRYICNIDRHILDVQF